MNSLVIGASGFIGNSLFNQIITLNEDIVIGTYFNNPGKDLIKLDMTSKPNLEYILKMNKPDAIYMPAFIPGVDYCESNEKPNIFNKKGVKNVVELCKKKRIKLIFFSSDYIFDGKNGPYLETDEPNPLNKYGHAKLFCESLVQTLSDYLIIRTTVVYGYNENSKNFLMTIVKKLKERIKIQVPMDQMGTPTYVEDLARISIKLNQFEKKGIYNVVGPDFCSRYIFALTIARILNLDKELIQATPTRQLNQIALRPLKAGLVIDKIREEINANPCGINCGVNKLKHLF